MNYYKIAPLRLNLPALIYKSNLALPKNSVVKICVKNKSALGIVLDSANKPDFECEWALQSEFYLTPNQALLGKFIASYYCVNEGVAFGIMTLGNSSNSSSLTQSSWELEKSTLDGLKSYHRADFPAQPTNLTQDTRIALANDAKNAESSVDSADSQNLNQNNPRVSANLETRPLRGAKNRIQGCRSASADFLLEAEKRGSPPKSEKRQLLARRGSGEGGAALLREKTSEISGNRGAESTQESQSGLPRSHSLARNDEFIRDSSLRKCSAQNDKNSVRVAESSEKSPQDDEFAQNLPRLSPTQNCALDFILSHEKTLLFGDTGSGKTEIYINAIARTIAQGKNVIFLMPEISLTPQMERRLKGVFGDLVCIWHSKITKAKKEQILSRLDSANSQNLVEKPCHSERSEETQKNLSLRANPQNLRGNPPIKKTQNLQGGWLLRDARKSYGLPRSHSLARNDEILDYSLSKCSAQNDKIGVEKNGVRVAESSADSANFVRDSAFFPLDSANLTQNKDSAKKQIKIIAGARSALFLPLSNIGLIIIDEEHDDAYKSNSSPRYNARDLAIFLAHKERVRLILGSATPSVNSYYNFSKENCVFRLRGGYFQGKKSVSFDSEILSVNLLEKIRVALENKAQSIIFVPLRGNFKVLQCESCGNGAKCKHCSINMSLHSKKNALICHYCGYAEPFFDGKTKCKTCNSTAFKALKIGTQEICKQLQSHFTHAKIAIFDRDEVKSDSKMRKILSEFNDGKIDILVGTQMISKGHDYHNVALVAILGIDGILNSSDFRAYERAVGLLTQISGRTARKNDGEVVINTRNRAFFAPFLNDYEEFLRFELENRKNLYPPFRRIALLIAQNRDESKAKEILQNAKKIVESAHKNIEIIGLNKAPIERINGLWRYFMLLRARSAKELVCAVSLCKNLPLIIDIDPQQVF